jgi:glycine oxidase
MKIVVIGGGVAGLAIGWRLASSGCNVELYERGLAGRASSWAAAGMLAATAETQMHDNSHARLAHAGRSAWSQFAVELEQISRVDLGYRECGSLILALTQKRANELQATVAALSSRGENVIWYSKEEVCQIEPLLCTTNNGALCAQEDSQVDNRQLSAALTRAFVIAGGALREQCDVSSIEVKSGRITGVTLNGNHVSADKVVIAAGAWSSTISGLEDGILPPVVPAKGQMAALIPPDGVRMPSHLIWSEKIVYFVPRTESLLIGATVEDVGFETSVTRDAIENLITRGSRIIPSLSSWQIVECWAGLRPRAPDDFPVVGATSVDGLFVASGQYRNGILFAPIVADIIRDLILEKETGQDFECFNPNRFVKEKI